MDIEKLNSVSQLVSDSGFTSIVMEAGHFYVDPTGFESSDNAIVHEISATIGVMASNNLRKLGMNIMTLLFVDDLHAHKPQTPESVTHTLDTKLEQYDNLGFQPDKIIFETALKEDALNFVGELPPERIKKKKKQVIFKRFDPLGKWEGNITLIDEFGKPSCALLDAVLYQKKSQLINQKGICITVLPLEYSSQQDKTKIILQSAGYKIPILNIYFTTDKKLSVDFDY